ncbi:hypothetical protein BZG36_00736 [Bifiguratus adelaidae]|uniref:Peptidyl-tRNA hydrolase n=1 Tax=Bifiguratus adelaidae TaxID=1938954 RepID=A0A261Y6Z0_9FUNG|nr:hypothetical protein BZG36_00736 [Bifiguratus adelaidae]
MSRPVDFCIVGLGNPGSEYEGTRHNAGAIFVNYLANAMITFAGTPGPPVFTRRMSLSADIRDTVFTFGDTTSNITNSLRILLVKPLSMMNESGPVVKRVLEAYGIQRLDKQLMVVCDDLNTLPGSLSIQIGGTLRSLEGHGGITSICKTLDTTNFVRFRLGTGRPPSKSSISIQTWVLSKIPKENREMDLFGYLLQNTTSAMLEFAQTNDLQKVKKKWTSSKKIPKNLQVMQSLEFPIRIEG